MNQAAHVQIAIFLPAEQLVLLVAVFSHQAQSQPVAFSRKLTCIGFGRVYQGQVEIIVPADACLAKFADVLLRIFRRCGKPGGMDGAVFQSVIGVVSERFVLRRFVGQGDGNRTLQNRFDGQFVLFGGIRRGKRQPSCVFCKLSI